MTHTTTEPTLEPTAAPARRRGSFAGWEGLLGLDGSSPEAFDSGPGGQAILYLRVSTQRQMHTAVDIDADGNSIATQRELCVKRCKKLLAPIEAEFVEPGNSAQSIAKRPVFRELLTYVEEHPDVRYVVIYMRSRIFRNQTDAAITKRILAGMGVKLISAKEEFGDGYMADAMEAITDIMNEVQVRQSGEDIKNKLLHKAKNGGTVGRAKLGYLNVRKDFDGRLVNTIDIDPDRAPLIRWAFEQYAAGEYSTTVLADLLEEQGLTTRKSAGRPEKPLSRSALSVILRDPYYIGMVTFKGRVYPGRHPALISNELFERVQSVADSRMRRGQRDRVHSHFLRGLMHCGQCHDQGREHRLIFSEITNRHGQVNEYYLCRGRQERVCELPHLRMKDVEQAVGRTFGAIALDAETIAQARTRVDEALEHLLADQKAQRARTLNELKKVELQEERLIDLAADGSLSTDKLRGRLRDVQVKKARLRDTLTAGEDWIRQNTKSVHAYLDLLERPEALYVSVNDQIKRQLLAAFFSAIRVFDDGHRVTVATELQPLLKAVRSAAASDYNETGTGDVSDARSQNNYRRYLDVIFSSNSVLVARAGLEPATPRL